jgi:two-component system, LuxR family, sensor kinase FixL
VRLRALTAPALPALRRLARGARDALLARGREPPGQALARAGGAAGEGLRRPFYYRVLRGTPMPVVAMLVGLLAGLTVWGVLDQIQSDKIQRIFANDLEAQLDMRSRESLIRFDQYMANYTATARLLANHRRLAEYLDPLSWSPLQTEDPVMYQTFPPFWFPDFFARNGLSPPSQVLLADTSGQVREIFQGGEAALPAQMAAAVSEPLTFQGGHVRSVLTRFADQPYLLVSDAVEDSSGNGMGNLVVVVPVNDAFLKASQRGVSPGQLLVALVDPDDQSILASSEPEVVLPATRVDAWQDRYLITSQSLPQYEGADWNLLFATFIPHDSVKKMTARVRDLERRQRTIAALVFILVFTLIIYVISTRLNKVLKRMSRFSQRALGIAEPNFQRAGNQLLLLEDWIKHFTQLVLKAREEMSRQHESQMRASEALKAAMMEAALDSIVTLNQRGEIIELNPTAERALGFNRMETMGRVFGDICVTPADRDLFRQILEESRQARRMGGEPPARRELTVLRRDGAAVPVELSIVPIKLDRELFYTLYIHDITKRREAEREIKGLARFAGESPSPILRVNREGVIGYANPASAALLSALGTGQGRALPPEWAAEIAAVLDAGEAREREADFGGQVYAVLLAPIRELGYVNIYVRDITAVRRAEQEARQHQAELVHVCRLSTLGEVATGMAHELNQPLSAIANYANGASRRLQGGVGDPSELVDAMGQITTQARRASEIIRRLRALVGRQPPSRSEVDLNHMVREVCSFVEFETAKLEVPIALDLAPGRIPVDADLVQIEQVLLNLVRNALDALEEVPAGARALSIHTRLGETEVEVRVTDNGPGVPPQRIERLFDPFFTTKETGMGMGLPISQTILESHDGHIWVESTPGRGTTVHVTLPVAVGSSPETPPREDAATRPEPAGSDRRVKDAAREAQ